MAVALLLGLAVVDVGDGFAPDVEQAAILIGGYSSSNTLYTAMAADRLDDMARSLRDYR